MNSSRPRDSFLRKYQRRKTPLNLDLTIGLPGRTKDQLGSSSGVGEQNVQPVQQQNAPVLIDVDAFDDEVLISSARAFEEARNNSRMVRGANVLVDLSSGEQANRFTNCYKRRRNSSNCHQPIDVDHVYRNSETSCKLKRDKQPIIVTQPPPPPPQPAFSCPICMGELVEEMSTKCGHIFCKKCIQTALSIKSICPTCRKKVGKKDVIRIYLPTTK